MKFITKFIACILCFLYLPSLFANQCGLKMSETSVKYDVSTSTMLVQVRFGFENFDSCDFWINTFLLYNQNFGGK